MAWGSRSFVGALFLSLVTGAAYSAEREHGSHVHGIAQLNVAVEAQTIEIEFVSPSANIVGFEHAAKSAEDKAAIERAVATLKDGNVLFVFSPDAYCALEEAEVESMQMHDDHDEEDHEHQSHAEHAEEHADEAHAEFHAHYHFRCDRPDALAHVDVKLFEHFPATQELEVQYITQRGQGAQELTPSAARLSF